MPTAIDCLFLSGRQYRGVTTIKWWLSDHVLERRFNLRLYKININKSSGRRNYRSGPTCLEAGYAPVGLVEASTVINVPKKG